MFSSGQLWADDDESSSSLAHMMMNDKATRLNNNLNVLNDNVKLQQILSRF